MYVSLPRSDDQNISCANYQLVLLASSYRADRHKTGEPGSISAPVVDLVRAILERQWAGHARSDTELGSVPFS